MEKQIVLSPEELYCLGAIFQAKYIDYAYIAALNDIGQNRALFAKETRASLVAKGVLSEDFSGKLELGEGIAALLTPIFFGEVETSLDICRLGDSPCVSAFKFHFHDGDAVMVSGENGHLTVKRTAQNDLREIVSALAPENSIAAPEVLSELPQERISRFFSVKQLRVGKSAVVRTFLEADGVLYREKDAEQIESVSGEDFINEVLGILRGDDHGVQG